MRAPAEPRKLALATLIAAFIAALVLVAAILPAEYGVDPTGIGAITGLTKLHAPATPPTIAVGPDDGPASLYKMRAVWQLDSFTLAQKTGRVTTDDHETRVTLPFAVPNLTSVTATLTWDDNDRIDGELTDGDTLELSIRGPGGLRSQLAQATNERGRTGNISATLGVASIPFPNETEGGLFIGTAEDRTGIGNWTFVIRLYVAGGVNGSEARDPGNDWTLTVTGEAYHLDVQKQTERLGDRVRITLAPQRGVEYKFGMQEGASMKYRWNATGQVYSDLHGDHPHAPDDFTSAKITTVAEDNGRYVAPFTGRHGWYWRNDGTEPVVIVLETTGEYTILGVMT